MLSLFFCFVSFFGVGDGTRALHMLGEHSNSELHSLPYTVFQSVSSFGRSEIFNASS
jgi:hypothetical protein